MKVIRLMAQTVDLLRSGIIAPLEHIRIFDISQIEQAMMHFARGTHIGKVVVTFKNPKSLLPVSNKFLLVFLVRILLTAT